MSTPTPELIRRAYTELGDGHRTGPSWNIFGDTITQIIGGKQTAGRLAILEEITPPGGGTPLHVHHREDEAFYVVEGQFLFEASGSRMEAGPGCHLFMPREVPHRLLNIGDGSGKMLIICQPAGIELFFEDLSKLTGPPEPAKVAPVFDKWGLER